MWKKITFTILLIFLLTSCTDPLFCAYEVTLSFNQKVEDDTKFYISAMNDNGYKLFVACLTKENSFTGTYSNYGMGPQVDLRDPDEKNPLKKTLEQIEAGGTYTIQEIDKDGNKTHEYTIECTKGDVKDITPDDCLYRCYEITLDWNKKVSIKSDGFIHKENMDSGQLSHYLYKFK